MRKLFFYIALGLTFFSCNKEKKPDHVIVSGKIENNGFPEIIIESIDHSFEKKIGLNGDGEFADTLNIDLSGTYIINKRLFIHLAKGNGLQIKYDAKDPYGSLVFLGEGAAFNDYLIEKRELTSQVEGGIDSYYSLERKLFRQKTQEIKTAQEELLESIENIPEDLRNNEKRDIHYYYLLSLKQYPWVHSAVLQSKEQPEAFEDVTNELNSLDYSNEADFSHSTNYNHFLVSEYYESLISETLNKKKSDSTETLNEIPSELIRNSLLYSTAERNILGANNVEDYYDRFLKLSNNDSHKAKITEIYQKRKETLPGQPSPKFINYENHAGGHTSLSDLKGKYVLIDVWATWCKPCLEEIPALEKLEEEYREKNIEFVSISADKRDQYERWKKMVSDKKLGGIQLIADNAFGSDFIRNYDINAIPRFILIDPAGNIINPEAPYPSDKNMINLLNDLNL